MLKRLHIENYALIEDLEILWSEGMTSMTGETGSGKSIVLGAMGLVLGHRTEASAVRQGTQKCTIEATFSSTEATNQWLKNYDYEIWPDIILRRELNAEGRSRAFINDSPVTAGEMRHVGEKLVDLHGQDNTRLLLTREYQLNWIDERSNHDHLCAAYRAAFSAYEEAKAALHAIELEKSKPQTDLDYIRYQLQELDDLQIESHDWVALENERNTLEHSAELRHDLQAAWSVLTDEGQGDSAIDRIQEARKRVASTIQRTAQYSSLHQRLEALNIEVKDIANELEHQADSVEENPQRLHTLQGWFNDLQKVLHKHNARDAQALIALKSQLTSRLDKASSIQQTYNDAVADEKRQHRAMMEQGKTLMKSRESTAQKLAIQIESMLHTMSMPNAQLKFDFHPGEQPDQWGIEVLVMRFSGNPGMDPLPLQKIASGGEKSRLMLAFKAVGHDAVSTPTIILDEIDTGVSGNVASKMARMMKRMSNHQQVIAVTHLPQVAAIASQHFLVKKEESAGSTRTLVKALEEDLRVMEIAAMLSGTEVSSAAKENAEALLLDHQ
jgi:DNA repair protein RecN (Recombination protein N)